MFLSFFSASTALILSLWLIGAGLLSLLGLCWHVLQSRLALDLQEKRLALYAAGHTLIDSLDLDLPAALPIAVWPLTYQTRFLFDETLDLFFEELRAKIPVYLAQEEAACLPVASAFAAQGRALQIKQRQPFSSCDTEKLRAELDRLMRPFLTKPLCRRPSYAFPRLSLSQALKRRIRNLKRRLAQKYWRERKRQRQLKDAEYFGNL